MTRDMGTDQQCSEKDGTCDEMADEIQFLDRVGPEQAATYKCKSKS